LYVCTDIIFSVGKDQEVMVKIFGMIFVGVGGLCALRSGARLITVKPFQKEG
jgi:hypothetical protein